MVETIYTACAEVRPYLNDYISVAEIQNTDDLRIIDLSGIDMQSSNDKEYLDSLIAHAFSQPIKNKGSNYLITQYISEYIKKIGFDGIKFKSSSDKNGINLTIFNYDKCRPINSSLHQLNDRTIKLDKKYPYSHKTDDVYIDIEFEDVL